MSTAAPRTTPNPWWVGVVAGMASYIDAAAIITSGIALVIYQQAFGLTPAEFGLLSGALTFAIAIGALIGGRLGDRFGRRAVFLVTMVLIIGGSALLVFGSSFAVLLPGIIGLGLGVGADLPVSLATIAEAATDKNRGAIIVFSNILWGVGITASVGLSAVVGGWGQLGGQIMFGQVGVVALIVFVLRLSIPESATWIVARDERRQGLSTARAERGSLRDLIKAPYRTPLLVLVGFYALTNLAGNTTGQFNTYVAVNVADIPVQTLSLVSLAVFPVATLAAIWFMRVVDGPLRMVFFAAGAVMMVVGYLVPVVFGFSLGTIVALIALTNVGSAFAFEGIMKVWTQESFPTMLRSTAQGTILAVARFSAALLATVTPALVALNTSALYVGLAAVTAAGLVIAWLGFRGPRRSEFEAGADVS